MTTKNDLTTRPLLSALLVKRMLLGAAIALILILIFLLPADYAKPEWGNYWIIRPLIVLPLAGAIGGACFHVMDLLSYHGGWRKILAYVLSLLVYIIGLWMGTVLGLNGTLWN